MGICKSLELYVHPNSPIDEFVNCFISELLSLSILSDISSWGFNLCLLGSFFWLPAPPSLWTVTTVQVSFLLLNSPLNVYWAVSTTICLWCRKLCNNCLPLMQCKLCNNFLPIQNDSENGKKCSAGYSESRTCSGQQNMWVAIQLSMIFHFPWFFVKKCVQNDNNKIKDQRSAKHVGGWTIINIINNIDSQRLIATIITNIQYSHH